MQTGPGNHLSNYETRIDLNGTKGRIDYPTLNCGGSLEHVRDDRDTSIFVEHLTYGRDKCIDGGRVAVRSHTNFVTWSWTYEEGDITVVGDLTASR